MLCKFVAVVLVLMVAIEQITPAWSAYSFNDQDYSCYHANSWMENTGKSTSSIFSSYTDIVKSHYLSGRRRLHGVSDSETDVSTNSLSTGWQVQYRGIPSYSHKMTSTDISTLNTRPKASTDFKTGSTSAAAGTTYAWGEDIGYNSNQCSKGYWPPGPDCPAATTRTSVFTLTPKPESSSAGCYTGTSMGYFVNGIPFWSWSDTKSYLSSGNWNQLAMEWEKYDLDVCYGHAADGEYHHHSYSPCLASQLDDDGTAHSPLYGFAFDGFPIFGPYQAASTLAKSCWKTRDYSDTTKGGCSDGLRSCILKDPLDYTQGTVTATPTGPAFSSQQTTQSSNTITASNGVYFEDYYYDSSCSSSGSEYLDASNGHDHGDGMGYHYHATIDSSGDPVFPYLVGPQYHGCIPSGSGLKCGTSYKYSAGAGTGSDSSSTCGTGSAMSISSQQCLTHSFDITSSKKKDRHLFPPAGRLGILLGIIIFFLTLVGTGLYCCCGNKNDENGSNYKTVPVNTAWGQNENEMEMQAFDNN